MIKVGDLIIVDSELYTVKGIDGDLLQIVNYRGSRIVMTHEIEKMIPQEKTKVKDFLLKQTPPYSTWIITSGGWREGTIYIDDEDLWVAWYPKQHENAIVKSYSYDSTKSVGYIEYEKGPEDLK